ncbi:unnamed protein product [Cuscuta campestris]|uniref:Uncharacterized protein n=1 Tax=Cuscuta campestris TaxID=132261 RepID=A0A484N5F0_9ASTE|nr:unnamed protein product [Cuscuta campestris]
MGWMEQNLSQQITAKNIHEAESLASKFGLQSLMNQNMNLKVLHLSDSETHIRRLKKFAVTADLALFTFWSDIFDIMLQFRHLTCEAIYREGNLAHYPANVHRLEANLGLDGEDGNLIRKRDILKHTYEGLVGEFLRGDPYFVFRYKGIDPLIPPTKGEAGSCLSFGDYASWRKIPICLPQLFSRMNTKNKDFKSAALEKDLELLCQEINFANWASEGAVNWFIGELFSPHLTNLLDSIKSHLEKYEEIGELICLCVREVSIVKVATLLHLGGKGSVAVDFAQTRQCVANEMGKLIDKEVRQLGKFSADKEKMVFMLRLLEVF